MDLSRVILVAVGIVLVVYDVVGVCFLINDHAVVHSCRATDKDVHAIWPTNLWSYCLVSVLLGTLVAIVLIRTPFGETIERVRTHLTRIKGKKLADGLADERDNVKDIEITPRMKFGLTPNLPDWLFLCAGSSAFCTATILGVMAFWGYVELFMTRPVCSDKTVAFDEVQLWQFGRVTFFAQLVIAIVLSVVGMLYWSAPFVLELTFPEPRIVPTPRRLNGVYGATSPHPFPGSGQMPLRP